MNDSHPSACLSDVPGSPGAPEVKDKTKSSITLSWSPPDRDGGSPVKGYIIEVHEEGSPDWRRVNPADKLHPSTEITVPDLKEGKKCKFRIYAVNAAGRSEPAKTADVLVQDILSEKNTFISADVVSDQKQQQCVLFVPSRAQRDSGRERPRPAELQSRDHRQDPCHHHRTTRPQGHLDLRRRRRDGEEERAAHAAGGL